MSQMASGRSGCALEGNPQPEAHPQAFRADKKTVREGAGIMRGVRGPGQLLIDRERRPPCLRRVMEGRPEIKGVGLGTRGVKAEMAPIAVLVQELDAPEPAGREAVRGAEVEFESGLVVPDPGRDIVRPDIFKIHVGGQNQAVVEKVLLEK